TWFSYKKEDKTRKKRRGNWKYWISNREVDKTKTFDNYVEGNFNKEAIRIAKLIVDGEEDYNPIFIYGKSGIGKTKLNVHLRSNVSSRDFCMLLS
ncbi:DnaA ATPase domain-containing protein, partial [Mycoplasmopsis bovis]|uniref:DnaA ATPase domain-containing protein n=1 Tax=Mycoplasmopsis bovis TaxID=28903 RepID=UPI003D29CAA9